MNGGTTFGEVPVISLITNVKSVEWICPGKRGGICFFLVTLSHSSC